MKYSPAQNAQTNFYASEQIRFKVKIGVFLVLIQDNSLLCLRRHNTGIEDGAYVVPMGALQEGETPMQAVIREAEEEVGIKIQEENIKLVHVMYRKHKQQDGYFFYQKDLFFMTDTFSGGIRNCEPHKADDVQFFELDQLPKTTSPFIVQAIKCILKNESYSEFGF